MMPEGEASQEPTAPEGAPASPPPEETPAPAAEVDAQAAPESQGAPETPASPEIVAALDWSHVRGFQTLEPPPEGLAARTDYAQELAKELNVRAARFARSVDESIVLSSDGVLRWLGDPIARLVADEALLQPRAIALADEALAGEERASVDNRIVLWLAAHVRKVLGPLLALTEAADLSESARPLAGKIAEALGVLEREGVRNEVRGLDQTARSALRKLGVRFGSLYIYAPALLKPGARGLCSLLWTLRRGQEPGADRLLAFAAAGRTSFANEGLVSPDAYRVAGFRLCGERVVRVDIIERLSDLIRAAIPDHMRGGGGQAPGVSGFLITPQMTSLTGCSGDAFASILRSLGFEQVKVSKAAFEAARPRAATEPLKPAVEISPETLPETSPEPEAVAEASADDPTSEEAPAVEKTLEDEHPAPEADAALEAEAPAAEEVLASDEPELAGAEAPAEDVTPEAVEAEAAPVEDAVSSGEPEAPADDVVASAQETGADVVVEAAAADEEIEIWRPAPRRPRAPRPAHGAEREGRQHRERPPRRQGRPPEAAAAPVEAPPPESPRPPRPERRDEAPRRFEGKGREPDREERRPQKGPGPRREQRPTQVDPDSPFAKLAALKPLLERRDKRP